MSICASKLISANIKAKYCQIAVSEDRRTVALFSIFEPPDLERLLSDPRYQQVQTCQNFKRVRVCFDNDIREVMIFANGERLAVCDGRTFVIERNRQPAAFLIIAQDQKHALGIVFVDAEAAFAVIPIDHLR
jgi:hypothetical protein